MNETMLAKTHPLILFWIGVLTGAIIVALVFMYRQSEQFQSSVLTAPQNIQQLQRMGPLVPKGGPMPQMQMKMQTGEKAAPIPQPLAPIPQPLKK